jgi:hypothetical protein
LAFVDVWKRAGLGRNDDGIVQIDQAEQVLSVFSIVRQLVEFDVKSRH